MLVDRFKLMMAIVGLVMVSFGETVVLKVFKVHKVLKAFKVHKVRRVFKAI
jgi:hypothetical protein